MTRATRISDNNNSVGPTTRAELGTKELVCRTVRLKGVTAIMFDRYAGDNSTKLEPHQKFYLSRHDHTTLVLPWMNVMSFLSAQNTDSAPKRILDSRKYKSFCNACKAYVTIGPEQIPFLRDGAPIKFGKFNQEEVDPSSSAFLNRDTPRMEKGIPNPIVRPVLPLPWELEFQLTLYANPILQEQQLLNVFERGGYEVGFGAGRPMFGKFQVVHWE